MIITKIVAMATNAKIEAQIARLKMFKALNHANGRPRDVICGDAEQLAPMNKLIGAMGWQESLQATEVLMPSDREEAGMRYITKHLLDRKNMGGWVLFGLTVEQMDPLLKNYGELAKSKEFKFDITKLKADENSILVFRAMERWDMPSLEIVRIPQVTVEVITSQF